MNKIQQLVNGVKPLLLKVRDFIVSLFKNLWVYIILMLLLAIISAIGLLRARAEEKPVYATEDSVNQKLDNMTDQVKGLDAKINALLDKQKALDEQDKKLNDETCKIEKYLNQYNRNKIAQSQDCK